MDDDMYVMPHWDLQLQDFTQHFNKDTTFICSTMIERQGGTHSRRGHFGDHPDTFDEAALLKSETNHTYQGYAHSISTHQPALISRVLWEKVKGYSPEFAPAIGTDDDLAFKCWAAGCSDQVGVANSLVYHFQSTSTRRIDLVAGRENRDTIFKEKYGMTIPEFHKKIGRGEQWKYA